jgi:methionyl aminopeptidase
MSKRVELKTSAEIQKMRTAGILLRQVFNEVAAMVAPGVTTADLDRKARRLIEDAGARPAFLGYNGFPGTLCTSVNEEVVHGIPSDRELLDGDIVSVDCGLVLQGFYSDTATTFPVGEISPKARKLLQVTEESLHKAIEQMHVGTRVGTVCHAVQKHAESHGFSIVRDYTGHGIGRAMHEPPQVPNFGRPDTGFKLQAGLVIAVEPMVNIGTWQTVTLDDNWTVVTADDSLSAHFEHTIAITDEGPVILTA